MMKYKQRQVNDNRKDNHQIQIMLVHYNQHHKQSHMKFLLLWMVLFIWAEILGPADRTELMVLTPCLRLDVLLFSQLSQPFASVLHFFTHSETAYRWSTPVKNSFLRSLTPLGACFLCIGNAVPNGQII